MLGRQRGDLQGGLGRLELSLGRARSAALGVGEVPLKTGAIAIPTAERYRVDAGRH